MSYKLLKEDGGALLKEDGGALLLEDIGITIPSPPIILEASNITGDSARVNAQVDNDGGASCEGRFRWRKRFLLGSSTIKTGCLDTSSAFNHQRKLARTPDGILHAVYYRLEGEWFQIFHAYSNDNGQTWTEEALTSGDYDQWYPSIATDSNGYLHVTWCGSHSDSPSYYQLRYRRHVASWEDIVNLTSGNYDQIISCIAVDSNDYLHIAWEGYHSGSPSYSQIRYIKYTTSWGDIANLTSGNYDQYEPCLAIDSNDYLHITWWGKYSGTNYYQIRYIKYTTSWQNIENLTSESYGQQTACLAIDDNDYLHVVWERKHSGSPTHAQIGYRKYTDSWGDIANLTSEDYWQCVPVIAIDGDNYLHVFWSGEHSSSPDYVQIRHIKYTDSWGSIENLTSAESNQVFPNAIWAFYPEGANRPKTGYALIWVDDTTLKYHASVDLDWEVGGWVITEWKNGLQTNDPFYADISDLEDSTEYEFQARLRNSVGVSDWSELACFYTIIEASIVDSILMADSRSETMFAGLSLIDGLKTGDNRFPYGMVNRIDALKLGSSSSLLASLLASDGLKVGDSQLATMLANLLQTDATKLGDTRLPQILANIQLSDGTKLGDTSLLSLLASLIRIDGLRLDDISLLELGGITYFYLTESLKVGDARLTEMLPNIQLSDGTRIGDSSLAEMAASLLQVDGVKLGDFIVALASLGIEDGVKLGDVTSQSMLANLLRIDGIKLDDFACIIGGLVALYLTLQLHNRGLVTQPQNKELVTKLYNRGLITELYARELVTKLSGKILEIITRTKQ